jgi:hypothetical protein
MNEQQGTNERSTGGGLNMMSGGGVRLMLNKIEAVVEDPPYVSGY